MTFLCHFAAQSRTLYHAICTTFPHKTVHFTRSKSTLFLLINDDCAQKEKAVTLQLHINKTWK